MMIQNVLQVMSIRLLSSMLTYFYLQINEVFMSEIFTIYNFHQCEQSSSCIIATNLRYFWQLIGVSLSMTHDPSVIIMTQRHSLT